MKEHLLTAKQLADFEVETLVAAGCDRQTARAVSSRAWPCTADVLAVRLRLAGYDATAADFLEYVNSPATLITARGGHFLFHRADFNALARKLYDAKRFTPAALERQAKGITAAQDFSGIEAEANRLFEGAQTYAARN